MLHREHPAPRLADHVVCVQAELGHERVELAQEEVHRPEVLTDIEPARGAPVADLVVEHAWAVQRGDRLDVVVCRSRPAVADDRRRRRPLANDLVPRP